VARDFVKVPSHLLKLHRDVTLSADIYFVNKIPFFLTLSRKICFTAVNHLANRTVKTIYKANEEIHKLYLNRGFHITTLLVDGEFAPLQVLIQSMSSGPRVNLTSASEHVPEIERQIRVVKERSRSLQHSLPFNWTQRLITIHIVFTAVKLLNHFPLKGGISDTVSLKTIMTGETLDFKKHLSLQLGRYCQVQEEDTPRNSQLPRTQRAICLGPSGNIQGGFKFMSLTSGKQISRRTWDIIPMPQLVIDRVKELSKDRPEQFVFTDRKGRLIGDIELPSSDEHDDLNQHDDHEEIPGVDPRENETPQVETNDPDTPAIDDPRIEVDILPDDNQEVEPPLVSQVPDEAPLPAPMANVAPDEITGVRRSTRLKFQTKQDYIPSMSGSSKYAYAVTQLETQAVLHPDLHMFLQSDFYQSEPAAVAAIMTQLSLKVGLKAWGKSTESSPFGDEATSFLRHVQSDALK
jgi:hypothetical protein